MTIKLKTAAPALLAAATLFLTACSSDDQPSQATPPATSAAPASTSADSSTSETAVSSPDETSESVSASDDTSESATESSTEASTSQSSPASTSASATSSAASTSSSKSASSGTVKKVVIKAFAGKAYPAKVGSWVKASGTGPGSVYDEGDNTVVSSFLSGSEYATIVTAVKTEKTPVSAGLCGGTGVEDSYTCYLETADGVINVAGDDLDDVVEFSNDLAKALGSS